MTADGWIRAVVEAIHSSRSQAVIYLAGGASQAIGWLLSVPGASNTILEVVVPYSMPSMVQLLGKIPAQFTSQQTAEDMALLAYNRALKLSRPGSPVLGVGFTGSLASARPKRGDHRFYLSTRTSDCLRTSSVTLLKGLRTREEEDKVSSHLLLKAISDACGVSASFESELNDAEKPSECEKHIDEDEELQQVIDGKLCMKIYSFSCDYDPSAAERKIILPGSFNPLHDGHLRLLDIASSIVGDGFPCFEISAVNADKPPLSVAEIKRRVEQFKHAGKNVIISNQPYFYKKAGLFPGSAFVIGVDTAIRLIDGKELRIFPNYPRCIHWSPSYLLRLFLSVSDANRALTISQCPEHVHRLPRLLKLNISTKYYDGNRTKMLEVLLECKRTGCTFLVAGRLVDGVFKVLEDFSIPEELKDMFISIPKDRFRMDISSTEIRNNNKL